jgi:aryl-alcohol dehydrogenase-like predicted oxidoreductase
MNYRTLGSTDFEISEIGFGCMSLDVSNESASIDLIQSAFEQGINYFDTADLYDHGKNEQIVGKAISDVRDQVFIATKVGNEWNEGGSSWRWNPSYDYIIKATEQSLKRLNTDYIDVLQLHGGTIEDDINESIRALEQLKADGKIRSYGVSSIRPNVIRHWAASSNADVVMMQYSLLDRRPEEHCLKLLSDSGKSVVSRGTLAKGLLVDKEAKPYLSHTEDEIDEYQRKLASIGNPLSLSLNYVLEHSALASAIIGIRTAKQLDEIIRAHQPSISSEQFASLSDFFHPTYIQIIAESTSTFCRFI